VEVVVLGDAEKTRLNRGYALIELAGKLAAPVVIDPLLVIIVADECPSLAF
jgi:hypothetical protein